ncbi:hypothetical protein [Priestia filamentosa]|uniref:hypothetical protein n=1 Tax=Priestia filamentosa TaxID=1402861 RepID=UPI000E76505E|nr:hypothetical protein [Priestia filamentosa]RJS63937.1 hypothetical protein CJ485_04015 [Priestia filamentosa]
MGKEKVTKNIRMGKIDSKFLKGQDIRSFKNGMATVLPVGTEIYSVEENVDILITEGNDEIEKYVALAEE